MLFKEIREEFLRVATEDADVLISLCISRFDTLGAEGRDFLGDIVGYLDSDFHSEEEIVGEDWGEGKEESAKATSDVRDGDFSVCRRDEFGVMWCPVHCGGVDWNAGLA
jgi:hypothetical protein